MSLPKNQIKIDVYNAQPYAWSSGTTIGLTIKKDPDTDLTLFFEPQAAIDCSRILYQAGVRVAKIQEIEKAAQGEPVEMPDPRD